LMLCSVLTSFTPFLRRFASPWSTVPSFKRLNYCRLRSTRSDLEKYRALTLLYDQQGRTIRLLHAHGRVITLFPGPRRAITKSDLTDYCYLCPKIGQIGTSKLYLCHRLSGKMADSMIFVWRELSTHSKAIAPMAYDDTGCLAFHK
jgi:hypothetical protein